MQGLRAAWLHESSFRLEVYLFVVLAYGYLLSAFVELAWSRMRRRPPASAGASGEADDRHESARDIVTKP